jgi:hypothetical protein
MEQEKPLTIEQRITRIRQCMQAAGEDCVALGNQWSEFGDWNNGPRFSVRSQIMPENMQEATKETPQNAI